MLSEVKADDALRSIPVVVMTNSDDEEDRLQSELLGVDSFITKPVDTEKFFRSSVNFGVICTPK